MDIVTLTRFFMWCTILNTGLLTLSFFWVAFGLGSDFVYRIHSRYFPMSRETFNTSIYLLFGVYKIFVFVFNLVPWLVLVIIK